MNTINHKFYGYLKLFRLMPVLTFTGSLLLINFALARATGGNNILLPGFFLFLGGFVINGFFAHSINDIYDWKSGTDKCSPGILSGGSKVLKWGFLDEKDLKRTAAISVFVCIMTAAYFFILRGAIVAAALGIGLFLAWAYTNPPLRLSYRPFMGELLCLWLSGVILSTVSYFVLTGRFDKVPFFAGVVQCTAIMGWLMQHHLPDIFSDLAASPRKLTTPAFFISYVVHNMPRCLPYFTSRWLSQ